MANCNECLCCDVCDTAKEFKFDKAEKMFDFECEHFMNKNKCHLVQCNIGDFVYYPIKCKAVVQTYIIRAVIITKKGTWYAWELYSGKGWTSSAFGISEDEIGKSVFLTYDEAKNKL